MECSFGKAAEIFKAKPSFQYACVLPASGDFNRQPLFLGNNPRKVSLAVTIRLSGLSPY
jgi:hypothetical protein